LKRLVFDNSCSYWAKELLLKIFATASEVAFKAGFSNHTYFSTCFKEEFGMNPGEAGS
jgi:AraC-like DNA-binding protein